MSKSRLIINAVIVGGRSQAEVARDYGVSKGWVSGKAGTVSLRHAGHLHHIGIGRAHTATPITLLIADLDIRIIATEPANSSATSPSTPTSPSSPKNTKNP